MTGDGTYLKIDTPPLAIEDVYAYDGGVFYADNGATIEVAGTDVKRCESYRGTVAFVNDRSAFILRGDGR